jgi:hypothetical protein
MGKNKANEFQLSPEQTAEIKADGSAIYGPDVFGNAVERAQAFLRDAQTAWNAARALRGLEPEDLHPEAARVLQLEYAIDRAIRRRDYMRYRQVRIAKLAIDFKPVSLGDDDK